MVIRFNAFFSESGLEDANDPAYLFVFVADESRSHYLMLQRGYPLGGCDPITDEEDADFYEEDEGVYVEVDGQGYSGYERISLCELSPSGMRVEFSKPLGSQGQLSAVEIGLVAASPLPEDFVERLRAIFFERESQLRITWTLG